MRGKPAPWLTLDNENTMHTRDHYLKTARRTNTDADWQRYRRTRNAVTYSIRQAKAQYCQNLLQETSHQPKDFWKNIKKIFPSKQKSRELPSMMKVDGEKILEKTTIKNSFCQLFSTIGSNLQRKTRSLHNRIWKTFENRRLANHINLRNSFNFKPTTPLTIEKMLRSLNVSKATGSDDIPATLIKDGYKELSIPLCHLINLRLSKGTFPTIEKIAKVTPLYKSGERSLFDDYRPISVLNIVSKILEKVVSQQITNHLEENDLLYKYQYGFRKNKCTQDTVLMMNK